jgi:magnesium transporter
MIKHYKLDQGRVVEVTGEGTSAEVMLCIQPTETERAMLVADYQIDEHNLASALDRDELPRLELDDNHLAVIFRHPKRYCSNDNFLFRIKSIGMFLFQNKLIVISPDDLAIFEGRIFTKVQNLQMLFLRILSTCVAHFFSHLQVINDIAGELEPKLVKSMENQHLLQMFTIEKSLIYYVNAIGANGGVIERLKVNARNIQTLGLSPDTVELVDDLAIENAQCLEQARVYANVFAGLMDARASIVNNNLNVLMKHLTVINVVFMPINVLASIGGMSEFSAWTGRIPWQVAYSLFMVGLVFIGYVTYAVLRLFERRTFR